MTEIDPNSPAPESAPEPESYVKVAFPQGAHSTNLAISMAYIDAAQLELAGHFLVRQAEQMYAQAAAQAMNQGKGIILPGPGTISQGLKI